MAGGYRVLNRVFNQLFQFFGPDFSRFKKLAGKRMLFDPGGIAAVKCYEWIIVLFLGAFLVVRLATVSPESSRIAQCPITSADQAQTGEVASMAAR